MKTKKRHEMIKTLDGLKGKTIKYWLAGNDTGECEYGKLLDISEQGILLGCGEEQCPNCGSLDFIPWRVLTQISYFENDQ